MHRLNRKKADPYPAPSKPVTLSLQQSAKSVTKAPKFASLGTLGTFVPNTELWKLSLSPNFICSCSTYLRDVDKINAQK